MQDNEKKPALRFKGFTDPWEQRKLGELIRNISTGKSVNSDEGSVETGDIGVLKTSCVSYDRFNPSESKPVVKSEQGLVRCFAEKDSVIVSRMNTPERVGACGYVSKDFPNLFLPDRLWKLKFQDDVDAYFVYMMLVSGAYKEKITAMASGTSGSMYNIPKDTFLNLQLEISSKINEQKKIGRLLRNLDTLITLHQRKYEKLVNIKKSMLDKMFPKNGASVPEIRFKGFTDPWEQRKLGEIAVRSPAMSDEEGLPRVEYEDIVSGAGRLNKDIKAKESAKAGIVFHKGDVLYGKLRPYLKNWLLASFNGLAVGDFWVLQPQDTDSSFLYRLVQSQQFDEVANQSTGTKMPRADWKLVSKTKFAVPKSVDEQAAIGAYFGYLDTLITLHQRKLEKLQNIKKSCLEKMFV